MHLNRPRAPGPRWPLRSPWPVPAFAAVIPPGVQLHATQTLIRNNGSEPESLDPALVEIGRRQQHHARPVRGPDRQRRRRQDRARRRRELEADRRHHLGLQAAPERQVVQRRPGHRGGLRLRLPPLPRPEDRVQVRGHLRRVPAERHGNRHGQEAGDRARRARRSTRTRWKSRPPFPVPFLPQLVSNNNLGPLHQASVEKFGKDWTKPGNMVSNGAYVLKDWQVNSKRRDREEPAVLGRGQRAADARDLPAASRTATPTSSCSSPARTTWCYQLPPGTYDDAEEAVPEGHAQRADAGPALLRASQPRIRCSRTCACARRCRW